LSGQEINPKKSDQFAFVKVFSAGQFQKSINAIKHCLIDNMRLAKKLSNLLANNLFFVRKMAGSC